MSLSLLPGSFYYSNWISDNKCNELLNWIKSLKFTTSNLGITGKQGPNLYCYLAKNNNNNKPHQLEYLINKLKSENILKGNVFQITINHYNDLDKYIIPHKDGKGLQASIITIGPSHSILNFYYHPEDKNNITRTKIYLDEEDSCTTSVWVEPKSCLILTNDSYITYSHGITPHNKDIVISHNTKIDKSKYIQDNNNTDNDNNIGITPICNSHLISLNEGDIISRSERYSIVIWSR